MMHEKGRKILESFREGQSKDYMDLAKRLENQGLLPDGYTNNLKRLTPNNFIDQQLVDGSGHLFLMVLEDTLYNLKAELLHYTAGISDQEKRCKLENFIENKTQLFIEIVAIRLVAAEQLQSNYYGYNINDIESLESELYSPEDIFLSTLENQFNNFDRVYRALEGIGDIELKNSIQEEVLKWLIDIQIESKAIIKRDYEQDIFDIRLKDYHADPDADDGRESDNIEDFEEEIKALEVDYLNDNTQFARLREWGTVLKLISKSNNPSKKHFELIADAMIANSYHHT